MAGKPAPDWYPDPENPAVLRWWDGARWSGETRGIDNPDLPVTGPFVTVPAATSTRLIGQITQTARPAA